MIYLYEETAKVMEDVRLETTNYMERLEDLILARYQGFQLVTSQGKP